MKVYMKNNFGFFGIQKAIRAAPGKQAGDRVRVAIQECLDQYDLQII